MSELYESLISAALLGGSGGGGGGGTTVVANPTLTGNESRLEGIQIGNTKFSVAPTTIYLRESPVAGVYKLYKDNVLYDETNPFTSDDLKTVSDNEGLLYLIDARTSNTVSACMCTYHYFDYGANGFYCWIDAPNFCCADARGKSTADFESLSIYV